MNRIRCILPMMILRNPLFLLLNCYFLILKKHERAPTLTMFTKKFVRYYALKSEYHQLKLCETDVSNPQSISHHKKTPLLKFKLMYE